MPARGAIKDSCKCKKCKRVLSRDAFDVYSNIPAGRHTPKRREICRECRAKFKRGENWHIVRGLDRPNSPNEEGLCLCGCGQPAPISKRTNSAKGLAQGHPARFLPGHSHRVLSGQMYTVENETGCWIWQRTVQNTKRPQVNIWDKETKTRKHKLAHRWLYELHKDPIPDGYELDHLCCNPMCVNPDHMEPVTPAENLARNVRRLRFAGRHWIKTGEMP